MADPSDFKAPTEFMMPMTRGSPDDGQNYFIPYIFKRSAQLADDDHAYVNDLETRMGTSRQLFNGIYL